MAEQEDKTLSDELKQAAMADLVCHTQFPSQGDDSFQILEGAGCKAKPTGVAFAPSFKGVVREP